MLHKLYRPADPTKKAEVFGYDNPIVQRQMGASLGSLTKAVGDSGSLGPVIRDDLAAEVYEQFLNLFPLIDLLPKREANGLTDSFVRQTGYSQFAEDQPLTVSENGTLVEDRNTYVQDSANIAVFGSVRGASLKSIFGARASGSMDVGGREVEGGLRRIAHDFQAEAFRMQNVTATGAGAQTNIGVYDPTGFKGLRYITEVQSPASNVITIDTTTGGSYDPKLDAVTNAISTVANAISDAGGNPDIMFGASSSREFLRREALAMTRIIVNGGQATTEVKPGLVLPSFVLGDGENVPFYNIPGKYAMGTYTLTGSDLYQDIVIADSSVLEIVWLGSETPTLIELPLGADRTLRKLTMPYWMASLEVAVPAFVGKIRLKIK